MSRTIHFSLYEFADRLISTIALNLDNLKLEETPDFESIELFQNKLPILVLKQDIPLWHSKEFERMSGCKNSTNKNKLFHHSLSNEFLACKKLNIKINLQLIATHAVISDDNSYFLCYIKELKNQQLKLVSYFSSNSFSLIYNNIFTNFIFFKEIFDSANELYFVLDENCQFIIKNKAFIKFQKKLSKNNITDIEKIMLVEIKSHCQKVFEDFSRQEIYTSEIFNGKIQHLKRIYLPFNISNKKYIIGHYQDITTDLMNKNKLKKELNFLHHFLQNTKIGYLFFNQNLELIGFNTRAEELLCLASLNNEPSFEQIKKYLKEKLLVDNKLYEINFLTDSSEEYEAKIIAANFISYLKITKNIFKAKYSKFLSFALEDISLIKKQTIHLISQNNFLKTAAFIGSEILNIETKKELYEYLNESIKKSLIEDCSFFTIKHLKDNKLKVIFKHIGRKIPLTKSKPINSNEKNKNCLLYETKNKAHFSTIDNSFAEELIEQFGFKIKLPHELTPFCGKLEANEEIFYCSIILIRTKSTKLIKSFLENIFNQFNSRLTVLLQLEEIEAQKENAIKLNNAKSDFVSNITHEIKNPMNAILGFSQILEKKETNAKKKEHLGIIRKNSEQLIKIVQDLSDISKIESNTLSIQMEKINLIELFTELKQLHHNYKKINPNIELKFLFNSNEDIFIRADFLRLKQILINFISNSLKYTPKGEINVGFSNTNGEIDIFVQDTGNGISQENINKIFNRYTRTDSRKKEIEGVGIGLSIAQELAKKMGTEIQVSSQLKKGSKFSIKLKKISAQKVERGKDKLPGKEKTLLIVEDNDTTILFYKYFMEDLEINYTIAQSAVEAEKIINSKLPDLIFCDIRMPIKSGLEFIEENKSKLKNTPFYFITADSSSDIKKKALALGCEKIIYKPIIPENLIEIIKNHNFKLKSL